MPKFAITIDLFIAAADQETAEKAVVVALDNIEWIEWEPVGIRCERPTDHEPTTADDGGIPAKEQQDAPDRGPSGAPYPPDPAPWPNPSAPGEKSGNAHAPAKEPA